MKEPGDPPAADEDDGPRLLTLVIQPPWRAATARVVHDTDVPRRDLAFGRTEG
jgi:hypothetical protein